jgi:hypothetical protein
MMRGTFGRLARAQETYELPNAVWKSALMSDEVSLIEYSIRFVLTSFASHSSGTSTDIQSEPDSLNVLPMQQVCFAM